MTYYPFDKKLEEGQKFEKLIFDHLIKTGWSVEIGNRSFQKKGINCFVSKNDTTYAIEIKSDTTASKTQNAFIETVSVDSRNIKGWAYTTQSDYIFYFLPKDLLIYVIKSSWLKKEIDKLKTRFPLRKIKNRDYYTHGILVPLWFLESHTKIINL